MFRIIFFIVVIAAISIGLSSVADMDGKLIIQWPGGEIQPTLMQAVISLLSLVFVVMAGWALFRFVLTSPSNISRFLKRKKQKKGLDALSSGLIAIGAGDRATAERHAVQARKTMPNDPMTQFLRAQSAELAGDTRAATRIFESMLGSPETELMGLRGLFKLALEVSELEAASQYARRAVKRNPDLPWAVMGLFDLHCRQHQWQAALDVLNIANDHRHIDEKSMKRKRAVLLTALADEHEDLDQALALTWASEAHNLAPSLVPAAVIAGRIHASMGKMSQTAKIIRRTWKICPHPDLALVNAFARPGDSVRDRLNRVRELAKLTPGHREAAIGVAAAAIEAKDWALAREYLGPLSRGNPTQRVCTLMARIEGSEMGDRGSMREWLARAVHAPADPAWIADGIVADEWAPTSPVTGKLDSFEWKLQQEDHSVPKESLALEQLLQSVTMADRIAVEGRKKEADEKLSDAEQYQESAQEETDEGENTTEIKEEEAKLIEVEAEVIEETSAPDYSVDASEQSAQPDEADAQEPVGLETKAKADQGRGNTRRAKKTKAKNTRKKRTKIFVSPPAPDDPGTETGDEPDISNRLRPVRF